MPSIVESAAVLLLTFASQGRPVATPTSDVPSAAVPSAAALAYPRAPRGLDAQDTTPRRQRPVVYSDAYERRLTLHRRLSYAMLPLFAASYFSGDQLFEKGRDAPAWARNLHRPAATGSAILFGANVVTGTWNLWEGRNDPNRRVRRRVHGALMLGASAGFTYAGSVLAEEAERSGAKRRQHRAVNLTSMGVATGSWLLMLLDR